MLAICPVHGPVNSPLIGGTGLVEIRNVQVSCPICGRLSHVPDGLHDLVTNVVRAFRDSRATLEQVTRFRDIAASVQTCETTQQQAEEQVAELGGAFLALWNWLNANGAAIQTIVAIIALYLLIYFQQSSSIDSRKMREATGAQTAIEQQILSELQKQGLPISRQETRPQPMPKPVAGTAQMRVTATKPNRHKRRAAKANNRRTPKPHS